MDESFIEFLSGQQAVRHAEKQRKQRDEDARRAQAAELARSEEVRRQKLAALEAIIGPITPKAKKVAGESALAGLCNVRFK